ncbi:MAG: zinc ribbon domain-containing protein [Dehalococcoidales bacterium]|nr:zinc ribbon domain-containing protein [Dehalococcoidales bacterium]
MPIYEYVCSKCKFKFELMRPISQSTKAASCPQCKERAERAPSTFTAFTTNEETGERKAFTNKWCGTCGQTNCGTCPLKLAGHG